jgi:hypothetical protein
MGMTQPAYTVAISVQDPLTAERLVGALQSEGIEAFCRAGGAASGEPFAASALPFWDIMTSTERSGDLERIIREVMSAIEEGAEANSLAAEEESLSGENTVSE